MGKNILLHATEMVTFMSILEAAPLLETRSSLKRSSARATSSEVITVPQALKTCEIESRMGVCARTTTEEDRGKNVAVTREDNKRMTANPGFIMLSKRGKEVGTTRAIATHELKAFIEARMRRWHGREVGEVRSKNRKERDDK